MQEIHPENIPEGSTCIGNEVTYKLKYTPATVSAKKIIRHKYLLPTPQGDPGLHAKIVIAPLPKGIIKNCLADATLLAALAIEKYVYHLPVHRQMTRFKHAGVQLAHSTMLDWISRACKLLTPLYESLKKEILKSNYLMMDETTMKVMDRNKKGVTHKGYFWAAQAPPSNLVFFEYHPGRGQEIPKNILSSFKGHLQSDGYICYEKLVDNKNIKLLCCMAHARRYFFDSLQNDPERAEYAMSVFGQLYDIERKIQDADIHSRKTIRKEQAKPIWEKFGNWLQENLAELNQGSAIFKAFVYTMKRFKRLSVYMEDGKLNIDNNPIERSIRGIALGRRNYLFCGSHPAAQRSAMLYSFVGSCKLHDLDPMEWLVDVLEKIQDQPQDKMQELLPHNWKKNKKNTALPLKAGYVERVA